LKSHDYCALPLCRPHHNAEHAGPFLDKTLVDVEQSIIDHLTAYLIKEKGENYLGIKRKMVEFLMEYTANASI